MAFVATFVILFCVSVFMHEFASWILRILTRLESTLKARLQGEHCPSFIKTTLAISLVVVACSKSPVWTWSFSLNLRPQVNLNFYCRILCCLSLGGLKISNLILDLGIGSDTILGFRFGSSATPKSSSCNEDYLPHPL